MPQTSNIRTDQSMSSIFNTSSTSNFELSRLSFVYIIEIKIQREKKIQLFKGNDCSWFLLFRSCEYIQLQLV